MKPGYANSSSSNLPANQLARLKLTFKDKPNRRGKDRKSTRLNSSHLVISYAVFCLKKKQDHEVLAKRQIAPEGGKRETDLADILKVGHGDQAPRGVAVCIRRPHEQGEHHQRRYPPP